MIKGLGAMTPEQQAAFSRMVCDPNSEFAPVFRETNARLRDMVDRIDIPIRDKTIALVACSDVMSLVMDCTSMAICEDGQAVMKLITSLCMIRLEGMDKQIAILNTLLQEGRL